ncbi:MAG: geranylgeranyl pyrophosphate synthetase [Phylliscum demangeonii]|nr:MAG: geranylgeranyl pyrophosphate synthetase [Phylliscum demangeonii]
MVSEAMRSPTAIPPRTSSAGNATTARSAVEAGSALLVTNGHPAAAGLGPLPTATAAAASPSPKSILKPVPEADWIAQGRKGHARSSSHGGSNSVGGSAVGSSGSSGGGSLDPARYLTSELLAPTRSSWTADKEKILLGPFDYLFAYPGKDFRTQLVAAFDVWLRVPSASLAVITKVVGMLHTASLLIDDVEDSSVLRRGIPVAHSIFGVAQTLNSSNYVYFCALRELATLGNARAIDIYTDELLNLHRGQGMDLFWRDSLTCPTEDDYLDMVANKTGGLFRLAVKLMQAESSRGNNPPKDCVPLVNLIGLIFQIRDDYLNLSSTTYAHNKGLCEDLTEGKFSFPVIHSIRARPENLQLLNILKQRSRDDEVKRYAVAYMETTTRSFEYTRGVLRALVQRARALVEVLDAGDGLGAGVHAILDKMTVDEG